MVDYAAPLYEHPAETWDAQKCHKAARHRAKDGCGTTYHFLGYIGDHYGAVRYNGGCIRDGEWYQGENKPLPIIDPAYELVRRPTWGWQIVKRVAA